MRSKPAAHSSTWRMLALGQKRTSTSYVGGPDMELSCFVGLLQPALEFRVHFTFLRNSDTMAHHRVEAAGFFKSGSWRLALQIYADVDSSFC